MPYILAVIYIIVLVSGVIYNPVSWDEGWNFCTARNWVENKHFGCLLSGRPVGPTLIGGIFPVLSASLGFELFGIDHISGRFFFAAQALIASLIFFLLTKNIFNKKVAYASLVILLLLNGDQRAHHLLLGGQAWGEISTILFLSLAYYLLAKTNLNILFRIFFASLCFGLAASIKAQSQPFILLALTVPVVFSLIKKDFKSSVIFAVTTFLSYKNFQFFWSMPNYFYNSESSTVTNGPDLSLLLGYVLNWSIRESVFTYVTLNYWLLFIGLLSASVITFKKLHVRNKTDIIDTIKISMLTLSFSWTLWFLFLSIDFPRYIAIAAFFGTPFIGDWFSRHTYNFNFNSFFGELQNNLKNSPNLIWKALVMSCLSLIVIKAVSTAYEIPTFLMANQNANRNLYLTSEYINSKTPKDSLVETYDSQIFFLLNRKYHHPPENFHAEAIAINSGQSVEIKRPYDPQDVNPSYILDGPWSREAFKAYQDVLQSDALVPEISFGEYRLYRSKAASTIDK